MKLVLDYTRLLIFSALLLVGVQLPAVVDQYIKRVDAHLIEAKHSLTGFQKTADDFFKGELQQLIAHYRKSDDQVFRADAANIEYIFHRVAHLSDEMAALQGSSVSRTLHVLFSHDPVLMDETMQHYSYSIILTPQALLWGLALAFLVTSLLELLGVSCFRWVRRNTQQQK